MAFEMAITWGKANEAITSRWRRFETVLRRRNFLSPLKLRAVEMYVEIDRRFSTETAPSGRRWAAIGAATKFGAGKSPYALLKQAMGKTKLLVISGVFRKAFQSRTAQNAVFNITRSQVTVGSNDVRANTLHHGDASRNIPERNIVGITKKFENTIVVPIFDQFLQKGWNG